MLTLLLALACNRQTEDCEVLVQCLEDMDAVHADEWKASHGPNGSCWSFVEESNVLCDQACEMELMVMQGDDLADGLDEDCDGSVDEDAPDSAR